MKMTNELLVIFHLEDLYVRKVPLAKGALYIKHDSEKTIYSPRLLPAVIFL